MAEKDIGEKLLEDYEDVFADIINVLAFHGKRLIKPSQIAGGPTASRYKDAQGKLREQIRDVVKFDRRKTMLAVFGLENQTEEDAHMVFRVMGYDYSSYRYQLDRKRKRLSPVITLVLHFGMTRWKGPKDVLSAVRKDLPYGEYLEENVMNPRIKVVDVAFLPKEVREQFTSDFKIVADYFCAVREKRADDIRFNQQEIIHVAEILDFFAIFGRDKRFSECKPILEEKVKKGGKINMCIVMDYAEKQGEKKGIRRGRRQGRREGLIPLWRLIQEGTVTMEQAAQASNITVEAFRKKLKQCGLEQPGGQNDDNAKTAQERKTI